MFRLQRQMIAITMTAFFSVGVAIIGIVVAAFAATPAEAIAYVDAACGGEESVD
jgi:hypothetical protein